jgi:hypothetical protein
MLWYQKSRENWVKFGDKNTSFFHAQTIIRRKRNRIHRLQLPNGLWSSDTSILQEEAQSFFKTFFAAPIITMTAPSLLAPTPQSMMILKIPSRN